MMLAGRALDLWADAFDVGDDDSGAAVALELLRKVAEASDLLQSVSQRLADGPGDAVAQARCAVGDCESLADELADLRTSFTAHVRGGGR